MLTCRLGLRLVARDAAAATQCGGVAWRWRCLAWRWHWRRRAPAWSRRGAWQCAAACLPFLLHLLGHAFLLPLIIITIIIKIVTSIIIAVIAAVAATGGVLPEGIDVVTPVAALREPPPPAPRLRPAARCLAAATFLAAAVL